MSVSASSLSHYYLAVVTLLDQLDPKEYSSQQISVILRGRIPNVLLNKLLDLFGRTKENVEFSRIVSRFLMDRDRSESLWVNLQTYVNLATPFMKILRDK